MPTMINETTLSPRQRWRLALKHSAPVAMGYIPAQDIEIGKHLNADVRGRMVELEIVPMPFYKLER